LAVLPAKATLTGGDSLTFTCDTQGVTWIVPPGGGTITNQGNSSCVYTAPAKNTIWFTRDVAIAAELNGENKGSAVITLLSAPAWVVTLAVIYGLLFLTLVFGVIWIWPPPPAVASLDVSPPIVTVAPGVTQPFEARILNARDQGVTWSATEGLVTPTGLFTAPDSVARSVLGVTSVADRNLTQSALIIVNPKGLAVLPTSTTLSPKGNASFHTMEYGATDSKFDWTVSDSIAEVVPKPNGNVEIKAAGPITAPKRVIVTAIDQADRTRQAAALLYLLPKEGTLEESDQTRDRGLLELVILMGALGALLGASRSLGNFVGNGAFFPRWSLFYLFRPTFGAGLALLVFFGYRIGAVTGVKSSGPADPFAATFVAGMVGLFADTVLQKLKDLVTALFPSHDERTDKVTSTVHPPAIESADGSKATGKMTIKGANFLTGAIVTFDLKPRATAFVNANELTVTLDPSDQVGKVKVIVTNPDKGASAAFEGTISA
jgi:hypothetical protein